MSTSSLHGLSRRIETIEEELKRQRQKELNDNPTWFVYVLRCESSVFYVGRTTNFNDRIARHFSHSGSRITRKYKPLKALRLPRGFRSEFEAGKSERNIVDALRFAGLKAYGASLPTERFTAPSYAPKKHGNSSTG